VARQRASVESGRRSIAGNRLEVVVRVVVQTSGSRLVTCPTHDVPSITFRRATAQWANQ